MTTIPRTSPAVNYKPTPAPDFRPMTLARLFFATHQRSGRTLHYLYGHFMTYGPPIRFIGRDEVRATLWRFLDQHTSDGVRYYPTKRRVGDVLDALQAATQVFTNNPPAWMCVGAEEVWR